MKDSEKHHESEKLKKKSAQELLLNVLKISINQWVQTEQRSENNSMKKIFTEKNEDWYETVLKKMKKLDIKKNENLMIYEWSHWITCHDDECKEHCRMKKQNQYYS